MRPIDQLEEYSAHHPETIDELLDWPDIKFEAAWSSYKLRSELDRLEKDQRSLVAAIHANGNMDGKDLDKAIESIHNNFRNIKAKVIRIYKGVDAANDFESETSEEFLTTEWWKDPEPQPAAVEGS